MKKNCRLAVLGAAVSLFVAGCRVPEAPRTDLAAACAAAAERRKLPRTVELMETLADRHVGRERQLARLAAAEREDFSAFSAENDPRFMWALEVCCWAELMFLPPPSATAGPETRMEATALRLLEFEQAVWWAKLASLAEAPASDPDKEACLLALELTTGWSRARIGAFDFSSLPRPGSEARSVSGEAGDPGKRVVTTAAELLTLASQIPPPERGAVEEKIAELNRARRALARHYLAAADRRRRSSPDPAALAQWRIARARLRLENSLSGL